MFKKITECRACGSNRLHEYLNLTDQPLANSYHSEGEALARFPLRAMVCRQCYHSQLSIVVDPDLMYKNYLYVSGTSQTLREYCDFFAEMVTETVRGRGSVLDIACNDGTQLDSFKKLGWNTCGVDPAANLTPIAKEKGHDVETAYWTPEVAERFKCHSGMCAPFDAITAQNVFAHTHDVLSFLKACKTVMHGQTVLFIQTSQADMFRNGEFDTMYHEHLSFFNIKSMQILAKRAGLHLEKVMKTTIHGTSYVFMITLNGDLFHSYESNVNRMMKEEQDAGLYSLTTYVEFGEKAKKCVTDLKQLVESFKAHGRTVVGYGAAAKGMTVLNFGRIKLDYIVDDNPLKQGLLTPGMNIPIKESSALKDEVAPLVIVPLAWNFFDEISQKVTALRGSNLDIYVRYFPSLTLSS